MGNLDETNEMLRQQGLPEITVDDTFPEGSIVAVSNKPLPPVADTIVLDLPAVPLITEITPGISTFDPDRCFVRAVLDGKTCDVCRARNGRKLSELIADGVGPPPYHDEPEVARRVGCAESEYPCRCTVWGPSPLEAVWRENLAGDAN